MTDRREDSDRGREADRENSRSDAFGQWTGFWLRVASLTRKEMRQLIRDPGSLAIGIGLPIVLILIFGYGLTLDVRNAPVAVGAGRSLANGCRCDCRIAVIPLYRSIDCQFNA